MRGPDGKAVVRGFAPKPQKPRPFLRSEFVEVAGFRVRQVAPPVPELTGLRVLSSGEIDQRTSTLMKEAA